MVFLCWFIVDGFNSKILKCYLIIESLFIKDSISCIGEFFRGSFCFSLVDWGSFFNFYYFFCYIYSFYSFINIGDRGEGRGISFCIYGDLDYINGLVYIDNRFKFGLGKFINFIFNLRFLKIFNLVIFVNMYIYLFTN